MNCPSSCVAWPVLSCCSGSSSRSSSCSFGWRPATPPSFLRAADGGGGDAARLRGELGLDRPLAIQYARWAGAAVRWNLASFFVVAAREPAPARCRARLARARRNLAPLTFLIGVPIDMFQAAHRGRALDRPTTVVHYCSLRCADILDRARARCRVHVWGGDVPGCPEAMRPRRSTSARRGWAARSWAAFLDLARHAVLPRR